MIRSELVQKIADENPHLYQRDVERIVATIFDEIIETMAQGDRVELRVLALFLSNKEILVWAAIRGPVKAYPSKPSMCRSLRPANFCGIV